MKMTGKYKNFYNLDKHPLNGYYVLESIYISNIIDYSLLFDYYSLFIILIIQSHAINFG